MFSKESRGRFLYVPGVAEWPQGVIEPEKKFEPLLVRAQLGLCLTMLERRPDPISDVLRQRDLIHGPHARLAAVHPERRDEPSILHKQRTNVRTDTRRLKHLALGHDVRLSGRIIDGQRAAFHDVFGAAAAHLGPTEAADQRWEPVDVVP